MEDLYKYLGSLADGLEATLRKSGEDSDRGKQ
jgi:hypothetical protein